MRKIFTLLLIMTTLLCCKDNRRDVETIFIDFDNIIEFPIENGNLIPLETSDNSLLYYIDNLEKVNDKFVIRSRDMVKVFDANTGIFLNRISGKGDGPQEYIYPSQMWADNDTIVLYDSQAKRILKFQVDGEYISSKRVFNDLINTDTLTISTPTYLLKDPFSHGYISLNSFTDGTTKTNFTASYYDDSLKFIYNIPGRELRDGAYLTDRMTIDAENKSFLMWEGLKDTLFVITKDCVKPLYAFDLGKYSLPDDIQKKPNMFERAYFLDQAKDEEYVSLMHNFQKWQNYILFTLTSSKNGVHICVLDTNNKKCRILKLTDDDGRYDQSSYLKIIDDDVIISMIDNMTVEANPALFLVPIRQLL